MTGTFRILLKQDADLDLPDTREFDLELGSKFAIGRASNNTAKGHLRPAKHNVYIDSPVVSREHATFTANATTGVPQVYITDAKSLHGTYVNGAALVPHFPKLLSDGDRLRFGVDVSRNDNHFVAHSYTYSAQLSHPEPFSRGFTVPEAESEEEDLDFVQTGCGSELDPLVLDESDVEQEDDAHTELDEHAKLSVNDGGVTLVQLGEEEEPINVDDSSEEEDTTDSIADDIAGSDAESDAVSVTSAHGHSSELPLYQAAEHVEEADGPNQADVPELVRSTSAQRFQSSPTLSAPLEHPHASRAPVDPFFLNLAYPPIPDLMSPPPQELENYLTFENPSYESALAPPLPPRPSTKRQRIWDETPQEQQDWFAAEPASAATQNSAPSSGYVGFDSNTLLPPLEPRPVLAPVADRIQTPPPTVAADICVSSPPITRRTGVSITEIVDDQPPTPTSINSRKRSADAAFDEEVEEAVAQTMSEPDMEEVTKTPSIHEVSSSEDLVLPTVEQVPQQPRRPIAQPKSVWSKALRTAGMVASATAYTALGATVSIVALTALPESFFTVP